MTKLQVASIAALAVALSVPLWVQRRTMKKLAFENEALRGQVLQIDRVMADNTRLSNLLARTQAPAAPAQDSQRELLKLRGQVGALRKTADEAVATVAKASEPPLTSITANPEMQKAIRDQQKMGLAMIYKGFAARTKLPADKAEALSSVLADNVMKNIEHTTAILREGKSAQDTETILAKQETEGNERVKALLGEDGFAQFQQYTHDLGSYLTSEQFKTMLGGSSEAKDSQARQLYALMQQETKDVLAARGLPADFQTVPTLNFRNIASEEQGENSVQLLDAIYQQVQDKATFLSPDEIEKFKQFRQLAVNNNRLALSLNRKLMAPPVSGK